MRELIIDLFAGGGGTSEGIRMAGFTVDYALNHDPDALEMHFANHPKTQHLPENIRKSKPLKVTKGLPVGLLWASPDCTHHSRAKGSKPVENKRRGLAWAVHHWARLTRPRVIILENVSEFKEWGPCIQKVDKNGNPVWIKKKSADLLSKGQRIPYLIPDPKRKGVTFKRWVNRLKKLGYQVEWRELSACDYGAPTIRKRLFIVARCDGQPIIWPQATHGRRAGLEPYRTAAECIDWSIPCRSIFGRKKPLAEKTLKRIARGIQKFVIESGNPFIMKYYGGVTGTDLFNPVPTVTTVDHNALVVPLLAKYHGQKKDESRCYKATEPLRVIDTQNRHALVMAFLTKFYGTNIGSDMLFPVPTVTATGQHLGEVRAFLVKYYGCGTGQNIKDPLHTITVKDTFGLVTVAGQQYQIADIGLRMLTPRELARAQGFPEEYILTGTRGNQVAKIGNSVSPQVACALVKANFEQHEFAERMVG